MKVFFPLLLCIFLVLPGCANIKDDRTRTTTEGALVGAGAGAGIGAIIGHFAGSAKTGALIGGLLGGAVGAGVGDHIADKKEQYATREKWLDACILSATQKNRELAAYSHKLRQEVRQLDKTSFALSKQYKQQQINKSHLRGALKTYDAKKNEVDTYIVSGQREISKQKQALADAERNNNVREAEKLDYEISQLEQRVDELRATSHEISTMQNRLSV